VSVGLQRRVAPLLSEPGGPKSGLAFAAQLKGEMDMKEEIEVGVKVGGLWVAPKRLKRVGTWSHEGLLPSCS